MKKFFSLSGILIFLVVQTNAQTLSVTVTVSNYNGTDISCFGAHDGSISVTVTGGTPPYHYDWSTGDHTASISNLAAGYYRIDITDSQNNYDGEELTLKEPQQLVVSLTPFVYANHYNISLYNAFNGSITSLVTGGTPYYTYTWDGSTQTTDNLSGVGAGEYRCHVTDANGCIAKDNTVLNQPDRADWTMSGNAGTNPSSQYIGTTDNQDFVFKTNNAERFRIKSNGDLNITNNLRACLNFNEKKE